jgi:hypothetical protein
VVLDSCNSGQLLESDENRPGPFNAKGLAQLAWDKGMFILTAAQSYQAALEAQELQHGYLTFALVEEGLKDRKAARNAEDGQFDVPEWFDYAVERVPEMQRERRSGARALVQEVPAATTAAPAAPESEASRDIALQTPRTFYRPESVGRFPFAASLDAATTDCGRQAALKSATRSATNDTVITFKNAASADRRIYYLEPQGTWKAYRTLMPGSSYEQATAKGSTWIVADADNRCIVLVLPARTRDQYTILQ